MSVNLKQLVDSAKEDEEKAEQFYDKHRGHILEGVGKFSQDISWNSTGEHTSAVLLDVEGHTFPTCNLQLPQHYREIVDELKRGQLVGFRGVFMGLGSMKTALHLNYVELLS